LIKHLLFDSAGCAVIRFFSDVVGISVHWSDAKVSQIRQVCPDSITDGPGVKAKPCGPCLRCLADEAPVERYVALGWDVDSKEWCIYMAHPIVFEKIFKQCKAMGVTQTMMASGNGPDVVLQRLGKNTEPTVMADTVGQDRGDGKIPSIAEALADIRRRSHWLSHASAESLEKKFDKPPETKPAPLSDDDDWKAPIALKYIEQGPPQKKKAAPPSATPNSSKEKVDPKKLRADDRWDMME
jgi:hypothetical protein